MGFYFTEIENGIVECAEQDQTAHMCRLILLSTLHKIDPWWQMTRKGLKLWSQEKRN